MISWHSLPSLLKCQKEEFRKSIAVYYLCEPTYGVDIRGKSLFAPT